MQHAKEKLIEAYREVYNTIPQAAMELDLRVTVKTMQALARAKPVSPAQLAHLWEMPLDQVKTILGQAGESGQVEINDSGDVIGAVLSLNPTQHEVSIDNNRLYAWCAFDAIFAPGVVGKPARIVSRDPVTGETIRITITLAGVEEVEPETAVVSVLGPNLEMQVGPEGPRCTQMLFFGSHDSADQWQWKHSGVSILIIGEAFEIVNTFHIEPARRLGLV
jgi:alkylmercury lyase